MNSTIKRPADLFAKIDSVFERAGKVFDEMPNEAIQLARNVGANKNVTTHIEQEKKVGLNRKIK